MPYTAIVSKYNAQLSILITSRVSINVPVLSFEVEYEINEIPKATIEVPFGVFMTSGSLTAALNNPNYFPQWDALATELSKLRPCSLVIQSISGEGGSAVEVFKGYIYSAAISYAPDGIRVVLSAVGLLADLGLGSTLNHLVHANSPTDFSISPYVLGAATIQEWLINSFPPWNITTPTTLSFDLKAVLQMGMGILLSNPVTDMLAAQRLQRVIAPFMPNMVVALPLGSQLRALARLASLKGSLATKPFFSENLPAFSIAFMSSLISTLIASPTSWKNETAFAKLLEAGSIYSFIIAPSTNGGFLLPDNPIGGIDGRWIIPFEDVSEFTAVIEKRLDIRGVVLVSEPIPPFELDLLSNQASVIGYYDAAWFPWAANRELLGALLVAPAPPWLKGMNLADYFTALGVEWLKYSLGGQSIGPLIIYRFLRNVFTLSAISDMVVRVGILYAGALFHKLSLSSRKLIVRLPLFKAMKPGFIVGPGTFVSVKGLAWQGKDWTDIMEIVGRVHKTRIIYNIEKKEANVFLELTHARFWREVQEWYFSNFPFYGYHPLWIDFPGINRIGID